MDVDQYTPTHTTTGENCTLGDDEPITMTLDNLIIFSLVSIITDLDKLL